MKKRNIITLCLIVCFGTLALCGCQRELESLKRDVQTSSRNYHIEHYSGGKKIRTYDFKGILNNQKNSDGYYFTYGDSLIELSGDLVISSTD